MKLTHSSFVGKANEFFRKLKKQSDVPDTQEARLAAARAIDLNLATVFSEAKPDFARGLLQGLQVPLNRALLSEEPYVFVSHMKPFKLEDGFNRRPDHFRAVDDTQFRPGLTRADNASESDRVARRLQAFIREVRRSPEALLEPLPAFTYKVLIKEAERHEERTWPAMHVLEYALRERNPVITGIIAAELANLARSPAYGEPAMRMLREGVALAVEIDDGPYASMLLMGLAAAQPRVWLAQRIREAAESSHPVAATLTYFQQFTGNVLGLQSDAWKAHWLHHDTSVRDFISTCTIDVLIYAADAKLARTGVADPIHRNHFMHGSMVLSELETRLEKAARPLPAPSADLQAAQRLVDVLRLDRKKYDMRDKLALLNARMDDTALTYI